MKTMLKQTPELVKQSIPSTFLKIIKAREVNQELEGKFLNILVVPFYFSTSIIFLVICNIS